MDAGRAAISSEILGVLYQFAGDSIRAVALSSVLVRATDEVDRRRAGQLHQ